MLTTEEVYRRYDKITAPVPLDGIVYFIAKFDGDPICPKLYTNSNGCLSTISEAEFLKEKAKKETLIELDEVPDLSKKDIETLNRMFKDLEL